MDFVSGLQALVGDIVSPGTITTDMRRALEDLRGLRTKDMTLTEKWKKPLALLYTACAVSGQHEAAHRDIEKVFATMQSDSALQETLLLSSYSTEKWAECFQLAKDLLATKPSLVSYQVALHLACNRFFMPQYALHLASRACEQFPEWEDFRYAEAVANSLCGDAAVYHSEKQYYWQLAAQRMVLVSHPKASFHTAMVLAQLGDFDAALREASKGLMETDSAEMSALLALIKVSQEDFTEADNFVKNGLLRHHSNLLLHTVSFLVQYELYKIVKTNVQAVEKKAVRLLRLAAGDVVDDSSSNGADDRHGGLSPIQEESANMMDSDPQDVIRRLEFNWDVPEITETVTMCAQALIETGLKDKAEALLLKLPTDPFLTALFDYTFLQKKNSDANLVLVLEGLPESPRAQELLSKLFFSMGKKEQAMAAAKLALKLGGPRREALTVVGNLYLEAGLSEKTAETALMALRTHETYFQVIPKWL